LSLIFLNALQPIPIISYSRENQLNPIWDKTETAVSERRQFFFIILSFLFTQKERLKEKAPLKSKSDERKDIYSEQI
jgi:hypothetical protein